MNNVWLHLTHHLFHIRKDAWNVMAGCLIARHVPVEIADRNNLNTGYSFQCLNVNITDASTSNQSRADCAHSERSPVKGTIVTTDRVIIDKVNED